MTKLLEAAKAVLDASARNHLRKHHLDALRQAVQDAQVYTPMTDDDFHKIASENIDEMNAGGWLNLYEVYGKAVERAVIERLGMRWPE